MTTPNSANKLVQSKEEKRLEFLNSMLYGSQGLTCVKKRKRAFERLSEEDQDLVLYSDQV